MTQSSCQEKTKRAAVLFKPPLVSEYHGWALLLFATLLILGGAWRMQSNMITSGLIFLCFGLIIARPNLKNRFNQMGLSALIAIGAVYTFLT
jgi:hypothetical protein